MRRRTVISALGLMAGAIPSWGAASSALPLVKVVHGFPVGGTADVAARRMTDKLRGPYAVSAIVDSRSGAGGRIAIQGVKSGASDGSVLLTVPMSALAIYPHIYDNLGYDPLVDLQPISLAATFELGLAVGPGVPAIVHSVSQLLDWMGADSARAIYGSPGAGTSPHFFGALIAQQSGVALSHVPYRGSVPGIADAISGQIPLMITALGDCLPHLKQNRLRLLASSGLVRSRFTPTIPTLEEAGIKGVHHIEWIGAFGPARMPQARILQAADAMERVDLDASSLNSMNIFGMEPASSTPIQLSQLLRTDIARWGPIIRKTGFKADG